MFHINFVYLALINLFFLRLRISLFICLSLFEFFFFYFKLFQIVYCSHRWSCFRFWEGSVYNFIHDTSVRITSLCAPNMQYRNLTYAQADSLRRLENCLSDSCWGAVNYRMLCLLPVYLYNPIICLLKSLAPLPSFCYCRAIVCLSNQRLLPFFHCNRRAFAAVESACLFHLCFESACSHPFSCSFSNTRYVLCKLCVLLLEFNCWSFFLLLGRAD